MTAGISMIVLTSAVTDLAHPAFGKLFISNPDLVICTLDDGAKLSMELTVSTGKGYVPTERNRPEEALAVIADLVSRRIPSRFGLDPFEDIQVLTPMNRGLLGTESLNVIA